MIRRISTSIGMPSVTMLRSVEAKEAGADLAALRSGVVQLTSRQMIGLPYLTSPDAYIASLQFCVVRG